MNPLGSSKPAAPSRSNASSNAVEVASMVSSLSVGAWYFLKRTLSQERSFDYNLPERLFESSPGQSGPHGPRRGWPIGHDHQQETVLGFDTCSELGVIGASSFSGAATVASFLRGDQLE